ncbi:hypothetical protein D5S17_34695 [Pseudonocardiaceae bacterium YIM PH 21723]|nr:hypothetical protein D5S17_34695 [Pseudonocardiaceae bacterium YIM PH 21723]
MDLGVLQQFVSSLTQSKERMDSALKSLGGGIAGAVGSDALNDAAGEFQETWEYGLGELGKKIDDTNKGVDAAHKVYKQVEDDAKAAWNQIQTLLPGN